MGVQEYGLREGTELNLDSERNKGAQASEVGKGKSKRNLKKILLLSSLGVILLLGVTIEAMHFTSQPSFCLNCHEMESQVAAWSTNPHKDITCIKCHSTPGTVGYVKVKANALSQVYLHVTNQIPEEMKANVDPAACIACHTGNSEYAKAKNIKLELGAGALAPSMPHAQILKENTSCLDCHRLVGHGQTQNTGTGN